MNHLLIQSRRIWTRPRKLTVSVLRHRSRNLFHPIILLSSLSIVAFGPLPSFARSITLGSQLTAVLWAALVVPLLYGVIWVVAALLKLVGERLGGRGDDEDLRSAVGYSLLAALTLAPAGIAITYAAMVWPALAPAAATVPWLLAAVCLFFLLIILAEAHDLAVPMSALGIATVAVIVFVVGAAMYGLFWRFLPLLTKA